MEDDSGACLTMSWLVLMLHSSGLGQLGWLAVCVY